MSRTISSAAVATMIHSGTAVVGGQPARSHDYSLCQAQEVSSRVARCALGEARIVLGALGGVGAVRT